MIVTIKINLAHKVHENATVSVYDAQSDVMYDCETTSDIESALECHISDILSDHHIDADSIEVSWDKPYPIPPGYREVFFTLDTDPEIVWNGITDDSRWNGFLNVKVHKAVNQEMNDRYGENRPMASPDIPGEDEWPIDEYGYYDWSGGAVIVDEWKPKQYGLVRSGEHVTLFAATAFSPMATSPTDGVGYWAKIVGGELYESPNHSCFGPRPDDSFDYIAWYNK